MIMIYVKIAFMRGFYLLLHVLNKIQFLAFFRSMIHPDHRFYDPVGVGGRGARWGLLQSMAAERESQRESRDELIQLHRLLHELRLLQLLLDSHHEPRHVPVAADVNLPVLPYPERPPDSVEFDGPRSPGGSRTEVDAGCCVCLGDFSAGEGVLHLPCSHMFHEACIRTWFKTSSKCPTCRYQLRVESSASPSSSGAPREGPAWDSAETAETVRELEGAAAAAWPELLEFPDIPGLQDGTSPILDGPSESGHAAAFGPSDSLTRTQALRMSRASPEVRLMLTLAHTHTHKLPSPELPVRSQEGGISRSLRDFIRRIAERHRAARYARDAPSRGEEEWNREGPVEGALVE